VPRCAGGRRKQPAWAAAAAEASPCALCVWLCFPFSLQICLDCVLNSPNDRGFYAKMNRFFRVPLKQGLRVDFKETEGGFSKNTSDVRPEAMRGLLVGKDKDYYYYY
jgi:hypothetical protein